MRFLRSGSIEVMRIGMQDTMQLLLLEDEKMIETLSTHAAQKPFTDGIGPFRVVRRGEYLDAAGCSHTRETRSKLAITIANEILRSMSIGGCLSQLLGCPDSGRGSCHADVDDTARVQKGVEEGKQRTEKEIGDRQGCSH